MRTFLRMPGPFLFYGVLIYTTCLFVHSLFVGGTTWDAESAFAMIQVHMRIARKGIPFDSIQTDVMFYGLTNIFPFHILSRILSPLSRFFNSPEAAYYFWMHSTVYAMSVATAFLCVRLTRLFDVREDLAWGAGALLMLMPVWLGHSFFNFKDIPTAFYYTFLTYHTCILLTHKGHLSFRMFWPFIGAGILLGGTKLILLAPVFLNLGLIFIARYKETPNWWKVYGLVGCFIILGVYLVTPASWREPLRYAIAAIQLMSKHAWSGCSLTWGHCIGVQTSEWNACVYFFQWFISQTPILLMPLFLVGVISALRDRKQWLVLVPVFLQLLLLLILLMIKNSVLYDAGRHTLFLWPMFIIFVCLGIASLARQIQAVIPVYALLMMLDIYALHPYSYVYFNEIARHFFDHTNMETDYWGYSMREALTLLPKKDTLTLVSEPSHLVRPYISNNITLQDVKDPKTTDYYKVVITRDRARNPLPGCQILGQVQRQLLFSKKTLILSAVGYCPAVSS